MLKLGNGGSVEGWNRAVEAINCTVLALGIFGAIALLAWLEGVL